MGKLILVINPGSTSTKISVFDGNNEIFKKTLRYQPEELAPYANVIDQLDFRTKSIKDALAENNININDLSIVVGRGGLIKPIPSGTYEVNEQMIEDIKLATDCKKPVYLCNRVGGMIPAPEEVLAKIMEVKGGCK